MSPTHRDIDLEALARTPEASGIPSPRRRWIWWLIPLLLLLGLALVFLDTLRGFFEEAVSVSLVRPRSTELSLASSQRIVFQTAGWIEPDPFPLRVTALTEGVVQKLLVQEADEVELGQPVCELVREDADLSVLTAEAELARSKADAELARVEQENSRESFEAALEVTEGRDAAAADLAARKAELTRRRAAVAEGESLVHVADQELRTQRYLREEQAAGPWQVELALARLKEATARHDGLLAEESKAQADVARAEIRLTRTEGDLRLRLQERLRVAKAKASLSRAVAEVHVAEARLAKARLAQSRLIVTSPKAGIVLTRDAQPGSIVGPDAGALAICQLYDPTSLRLRVDVPQSQIEGALVGQRAEIRCDARRGRPYAGRVLRVVESADIQKVTLEVQVRVLEPDRNLKPQMLCQVVVFGTPQETSQRAASAFLVPARCLVTNDSVWVIDGGTGRATLRRVTVASNEGNDAVIADGLNLTDKVIDRGKELVHEGARVRAEEHP